MQGITPFLWFNGNAEVANLGKSFSREATKTSAGWLKDKYGVCWQIVPRCWVG